jgi:hypothetical protein
MTPTEIIEQAKKRFDVLYYNDSDALIAMMNDSLGVFEDKAGAIRSVRIESPETSIAKPDDFLAISCVQGASGLYVDHEVGDADITISGRYVYPVEVKYLVQFRGHDHEAALPGESVGLILDHFAACLAVRNTRRERNMAIAAGLQVELPAEDVLTAHIEGIETAMEETAAIIPMITVA